MKFKNRKEKRQVNERMEALLLPIKYYVRDDIAEIINIALEILQETEVEDANSN